jgi:type IV pilus assembly protein PilV
MAMRTVQSQAGVMLIEALIGILIFSIGILALLGMQGSAIKNTADSRYRSEAAYFASQLIGEIWINDKDMLSNWDTRPTKGPALFAPRDDWMKAVAATLPGQLPPTIAVGPDPIEGLADREVRVTIRWQHPGEDKETTRQVVIVNRIYKAETI